MIRSGNVKQLYINKIPYSAGKTKACLENYKWGVLQHPPHGLDLYHQISLFGTLKTNLGKTHFQNKHSILMENVIQISNMAFSCYSIVGKNS